MLARLCSTTPEALYRSLAPGRKPTPESGGFLRWQDLPGARALDCVREPLPPGIPERVQRVDGPPLWWTAASGSGRSLTGAWLRARGRAAFVTGRNWSSIKDAVPDGPVFVELLERGAEEPNARPGLTIAAPFAPSAPGFEPVATPALAAVLDLLAEWALVRVPADTRLQEGHAREFLAERLEEGLISTLGDALGWLGLLDELGEKELRRPLERVLRRFVERRVVDALDPGAAHAAWLRRSIYPLLLGLVERTFTDSDASVASPRTLEEWMELVPPEVERSVDVEWMRLSLARVETRVRAADLERAARQLPPGAYRVTSALERAGLLVPSEGDGLKLGPCWLRSALAHQAARTLVERSPFEWGEALLRAHGAPRIAGALFERTLAHGGSALETVLDLDAEDQPAYVAALDAAFRVAAVARLQGADVGLELLDGLLLETDRLVVELAEAELPRPRIELARFESAAEHPDAQRGEQILEPGTFFLAVLSALEGASVRAPRLRALDPWHGTRPTAALKLAYDAIDRGLTGSPPWQQPSYALIARARAVIGNVLSPELPHALERPAQILDEIQHSVLSAGTLEGLSRAGLSALFRLAQTRRVQPALLAHAIWAALEDAPCAEILRFLAACAPEEELFWRHVPDALLEHLLGEAPSALPFARFGAEQWRALARSVAQNPRLTHLPELWLHMPGELVFATLEGELARSVAPTALPVLWTRFPERLRALLRERLFSGRPTDPVVLGALLDSLPLAESATLLGELGSPPGLRGISSAAIPPLRKLLHRSIATRAPGWRVAYDLFTELERELRRVAIQ